MEMRGEEINIRMARGSNENAVEEKMNKEKQHAHSEELQLSRSILE